METFIEVNGNSITTTEVQNIVNEIIEILSQKNITHAIAYMILETTKQELENTIVKKS